MDNGVSLADIAAVTDKANGGFGGGSGDWLAMIFLFALIFGFGGNGFGNRGAAPQQDAVTEAGLCNAMNFNGLENAVGRMNDNAQHNYMGLQNGLSNLGYETLRNFNNVQGEINGVQGQIAQCCCTTQRAIDGVNYNGAINTAQITEHVTAQTQKILDAIGQNRMADMQNQINQLQLQAQLCGVVRYPNQFTYNAGANPFCGCGGNM